MKKLQVFDPALCCSSGVCGTDVDQKLVDFSADSDWAKQQGAVIERFNLAQQPIAFAEHAEVKKLLQEQGEAALPALLLDGALVLSGRYPTRAELAQWLGLALPTTLFTPQVAELVAIGAAIASNCEPCFKYHFDAARKLGVSQDDMLQAVNLAQQVKDSPARAVRELALRMLTPETAASQVAAGGCCTSPAAATQPAAASCCGGGASATAAAACCGENAPAKSEPAAGGACCGGSSAKPAAAGGGCCGSAASTEPATASSSCCSGGASKAGAGCC